MRKAGFGLVVCMGTCVYQFGTWSKNQDMDVLCKAMYHARGAAAQAEGVVAVDIHEGRHVWKPHMTEFLAIGTAVLPLDQEIAPERSAYPILVLSVSN